MLTFLFLLACEATPLETRSTDNPEVPVSRLFTKDDCTVYRFRDGDSHMHYFARCTDSSSTSTFGTYNCGKNCTREEQVPTIETRR